MGKCPLGPRAIRREVLFHKRLRLRQEPRLMEYVRIQPASAAGIRLTLFHTELATLTGTTIVVDSLWTLACLSSTEMVGWYGDQRVFQTFI